MAIKQITKTSWPEVRKFLVQDGFRFVAEYIEAMWKKENEFYNMIEQLTEENRKLKETDKK